MRLNQEEYSIQTGGIDNSTNFHIEMTAKSFQILFDGIYTQKEMAVVRELICNAADAHTDAGTIDKFIQIHIPNDLEPWFEVKDNGTGLTHDEVTELYTTLFRSTKDMRNDMIGALGLGSKTPFAVGDSFNVISRQNGTARTYTAYLNDAKIPSITFLGAKPTDEDNGLTVRVPVDTGKRHTFIGAVKDVLYTFGAEYNFEVVGDMHTDYSNHYSNPENVGHMYGDTVYGSQTTYSDATHYAIMGNVAYPIKLQKLDSAIWQFMSSIRTRTYTHFEIGDLDIQASREELGYDDRTIAALEAKLSLLKDGLLTDVKTEIDGVATYLDAVRKLNEMDNKFYAHGRGFKVSSERAYFWEGVPVKVDPHITPKTFTFQYEYGQDKDGNPLTETRRSRLFNFVRRNVTPGNMLSKPKTATTVNWADLNQRTFIFKDTDKLITKRVVHAWHGDEIEREIVFIDPVDGDEYTYDQFVEDYSDVITAIKLSDLEVPPKVARDTTGYQSGRISRKKLDFVGRVFNSGSVGFGQITTEEDLPEGNEVYFVDMVRNVPRSLKVDIGDLVRNEKGITLMGVRGPTGNRIAAKKGWKPVEELIEQMYNYSENDIAKISAINKITHAVNYNESLKIAYAVWEKGTRDLMVDEQMNRQMNAYFKLVQYGKDHEGWVKRSGLFLSYMSTEMSAANWKYQEIAGDEIEAIDTTFTQDFPLFDNIPYYVSESMKTEYEFYIEGKIKAREALQDNT